MDPQPIFVRGLIMDIEATGDVPRADHAFDQFPAALASMITGPGCAAPAEPAADTPTVEEAIDASA
jgi:hypothetical protein